MNEGIGYKRAYSVLGRCPHGTGELAGALAKAVPSFAALVRNRVSHFAKKGKDGKPIPDYADLAQCHKAAAKALAEQGLAVVQTLTNNMEGEIVLCTQLLHSSGQYIESLIPIKNATSPQQLAAAVTYARRTAYCAMVGLAADDDDDGLSTEADSAAEDLKEDASMANMAIAALRAAKDVEERAAILARAELRTKEGKLSLVALQELKVLASELDLEAKKPERRRPSEPAKVPA